jgi:hypothetical protein
MTKITKIVKGFSRKIGSTESFSSFDFSPCIIEVELDEPIDISTKEGIEQFQKASDEIFRLVRISHNRDVKECAAHYPELQKTIEKKRETGLW